MVTDNNNLITSYRAVYYPFRIFFNLILGYKIILFFYIELLLNLRIKLESYCIKIIL